MLNIQLHMTTNYQKVEYAQAEEIECDAHVAVIVEPVEYLYAQMGAVRVALFDFVQHVDL